MNEDPPAAERLGQRLRHIADLSLALVENRLALAAAEVEGRLAFLQRMLAWGVVTALAAAFALQAIALAVIVWFWDTHRMAAISSVAGFFLGMALIGGFTLRRQVTRMPGLLEHTLQELKADRDRLSGRVPSPSGREGPAQ